MTVILDQIILGIGMKAFTNYYGMEVGILNKKTLLILVFLISSLLVAFTFNKNSKQDIPIEVVDIANESFEKVVDTISIDLEETTGGPYKKENFSLGKEYYRVSYINNIDHNKDYFKLQDIMTPSDEWLFIIEYEGKAISYMLVGNHGNSYNLLMYGGNAEMFNESLKFLEKSSNHMNLDVLSYMNDFYLVDGNDQVIQVPATRELYSEKSSMYSTPLKNNDCLNIILNRFKDSINNQDEEAEYGFNGLIEEVHKSNN